jgi:hypothetical protein
MTRLRCVTVLALVALIGWRGLAHGQWVPLAGPLDAQNFPDFLQDRMWDDIVWRQPVIRGAMRRQGLNPGEGLYAGTGTPAGGGGGSPATRRAVGATTFRPGPRTVLDQAPAQLRAQMTKVLAGCDQIYDKTMQQMGVARPANGLEDVANATAFFVAMIHHIYWDGQPGAPASAAPANVRYLTDQLRTTLARGRLAAKSDEEKQRAHDSLLLSTCIPLIQHTKAKKEGNQAARQPLRAQAVDLLAKVGLTPTSLRFNPDGTVVVTPPERGGRRAAGG